MTEKKQENSPKQDPNVPDDPNGADEDLESLSSDEKAAFDKIMAEIASATGIAPADTPDDAGVEQSQNATHEVQNQKGDATDTPSGPEAAPSENGDENNLDDEQQAALDKIMAEINSLNGSEQGNPPESTQNASENENNNDQALDENQLAAQNKIMAEIEARKEADKTTETEEPDPPPQVADDSENLDEDQEAALNKIMAEIEARKEVDKTTKTEEPDPPPQVADDSENLDEDQEAALNKIMTEIKARKEADKTTETEEPDPPPQVADDNEDLTEDQEAALNKIMTEIEARKDGPQEAPSENSIPSKDMDLSLDEFNQELTQLLSGQESADQENEVTLSADREDRDDESSATIDNEKDVNEALKKIIGDHEPEDEQPARTGNEEDSQGDLPDSDPSETLSKHQSSKSGTDYPILKEIDVQEATPALSTRKEKIKTRKTRNWGKPLRKGLITASILLAVSVLALAGYWTYANYFDQIRGHIFAKKASPGIENQKPVPAKSVAAPAPSPPPRTVVTDASEQPKPAPTSKATDLTELMTELAAARKELLAKMDEIKALKSYYQKGIEEEATEIEGRFKDSKLPSYAEAVKDPKIELSLKAIQRRTAYIERIRIPLDMLFSASEQLLFLQRRTRIYNVLIAYVSGFPVLDYQTEVKQIMGQYLKEVRGLSVDKIEVNTTDLKSVWNSVAADLKAKTARRRAYELTDPKDRAISKEICMGNFQRKYLLTVLNPDTAHCLVRWNGKDMYLNELTHLTPEVAEILAQWPGEWLSLNGLKELSPETAALLAKWRGKRLSLNGLTRLSAKTTDYLSTWQGEQLELISLRTMGRWENYGTKLFLSENLQRQLEGR